jgi:hypothetical protein
LEQILPFIVLSKPLTQLSVQLIPIKEHLLWRSWADIVGESLLDLFSDLVNYDFWKVNYILQNFYTFFRKTLTKLIPLDPQFILFYFCIKKSSIIAFIKITQLFSCGGWCCIRGRLRICSRIATTSGLATQIVR